ncbi:MAG: adenylosuccinate lyase [Desulfobacterales bacterium]|nr:adenylosuccinate lyase [Desulfobacterales bacterium]
MDHVKALTVLDGRYSRLTRSLCDIFSEYGLIRHRVLVEARWLEFIIDDLGFASPEAGWKEVVQGIAENFDEAGALRVKEIERTTNHDVKAVEYYIKEKLDEAGLSKIREWTHFACTSDDINNTAYALMIKAGRDEILKVMEELVSCVEALAKEWRDKPMMSRTHGQPATPTTVGKELVNFAWRIRREMKQLASVDIGAKMNGATGGYNAHWAAFPEISWIEAGERFVRDYLKVSPLFYTTQINPNSYIAETLHSMVRAASILIDMDRDMWGYISLGYFKQKTKEGEVGSSTMPHKVNPIDFENSEGNLGVAISMMDHLAVKLLNSRFQRDLTDSTVLRNMGALFGYVMIGMKNTIKGLGKVELNEAAMLADLDENQALLAEPIQTVMRVYGEENPYEKLKALTRGVRITQDELVAFVDSLEKVPAEAKARMKELTPARYIGLAIQQVDHYFKK